MQPSRIDGTNPPVSPTQMNYHPRMQQSARASLIPPGSTGSQRLSVSELTKSFETKTDPSVPPRPKPREEVRESVVVSKHVNMLNSNMSGNNGERGSNGMNPLLNSHLDIIIRLTEKTQKGTVNLHAATIGKIDAAKQTVKERTQRAQEQQQSRQEQFQQKTAALKGKKSSTGMSWMYGMVYRAWDNYNLTGGAAQHMHDQSESRASSISQYNSSTNVTNGSSRPSIDSARRIGGSISASTAGSMSAYYNYTPQTAGFSQSNMAWLEQRQLGMIEEGLPFYDFRRNQVFISKERAHLCFEMLSNGDSNNSNNSGKMNDAIAQNGSNETPRPLSLVFSSSKAHCEDVEPHAVLGTNIDLTEHRHQQRGFFVSIVNDDGVLLFENKTELRKPFVVLPQMGEVLQENNEVMHFSLPSKDGDVPLALYGGNFLQGIGAGQLCCSTGSQDQKNSMRETLASSVRAYFLQLLFGNQQYLTPNMVQDHMEPVMQLHMCGCPCCTLSCSCTDTLESALVEDQVARLSHILDYFVGELGRSHASVQVLMSQCKNSRSEEDNEWAVLEVQLKPVDEDVSDVDLQQNLRLSYVLPREACSSPSVAYLGNFLQSSLSGAALGRDRRTPSVIPQSPTLLTDSNSNNASPMDTSPTNYLVENSNLDKICYHALHYNLSRGKALPRKPVKSLTAIVIPERWRRRTALWTDQHSAVVLVRSIGSDAIPLSSVYICFCGNYNKASYEHKSDVILCAICHKLVPIFLHKYTLKSMYSRVRSIAPMSCTDGTSIQKHNSRDCPYCVPVQDTRKKTTVHRLGHSYCLDLVLAKPHWRAVFGKFLKSQLCSESIEFHIQIVMYYKLSVLFLALHWRKVLAVDILNSANDVPDITHPSTIVPTPQLYEIHGNAISAELYSKCMLNTYVEYLSKTGGHIYACADGSSSLNSMPNLHTNGIARVVALEHCLGLQEDLVFLGERRSFAIPTTTTPTSTTTSLTLEQVLSKYNANDAVHTFHLYLSHEYKLQIANDPELDLIASNTTAEELQECLSNIILYTLKTYIEQGAPKQVNLDSTSRTIVEIAAQHTLTCFQKLRKTGFHTPFSPLLFSAGHKVVYQMVERDVFKRFVKSSFYQQQLLSGKGEDTQRVGSVSGWSAESKDGVLDELGFGYLHLNIHSVMQTATKTREQDVFITISYNDMQVATPVVDQSGCWDSMNELFVSGFTSKKKTRPLIILREGHVQLPHSCPIFRLNQSCPGFTLQLRRWTGESRLSVGSDSSLLASMFVPFDALILPVIGKLSIPLNNHTTNNTANIVENSQYGEFFYSDVQDRVFFNYDVNPMFLSKQSKATGNIFEELGSMDLSDRVETNNNSNYKYVIELGIEIRSSCTEAARQISNNHPAQLKYITHNLLVAPAVNLTEEDDMSALKTYVHNVHKKRFKVVHIAGDSNLFWWNLPQSDVKKQPSQNLVEYQLRKAGLLQANPAETSQSGPSGQPITPSVTVGGANMNGARLWPFLENDRYEDMYCQRDQCPPLLSLLLSCKRMQSWLDRHPQNVLLLQSHNGIARPGLFICCYLLYSGKCKSSSEAITVYTKQYDSSVVPNSSNGNINHLNNNSNSYSVENTTNLFTPSQINYIYAFELFLTKHQLAYHAVPISQNAHSTALSPSISVNSSRYETSTNVHHANNNNNNNTDISVTAQPSSGTSAASPVHGSNSLCLYDFHSPLYSLQSIRLGPIPAAKRFKVRNVIQRLKGTTNQNHGKIQAQYNICVLSHDHRHQDNTPLPHLDYLDDGKNMYIKASWDAGIPIQGDVKIEIWDQLMATLQSLPVCSLWLNTNTLETVNSHTDVSLQRATPLSLRLSNVHNTNHQVQSPELACNVAHGPKNVVTLNYHKDELDYACNDTVDRVTPSSFNVVVEVVPIHTYNNKYDRQVSLFEWNQRCNNSKSTRNNLLLSSMNNGDNHNVPQYTCDKCGNCGHCFACLLAKSTYSQTKNVTYQHNVSTTHARLKLDLQVGMAARLSKTGLNDDDDAVIMQTVSSYDLLNDAEEDNFPSDVLMPNSLLQSQSMSLVNRNSLISDPSPLLKSRRSTYIVEQSEHSISEQPTLFDDGQATMIKRAPNLPLPPPPPPM